MSYNGTPEAMGDKPRARCNSRFAYSRLDVQCCLTEGHAERCATAKYRNHGDGLLRWEAIYTWATPGAGECRGAGL